MSALSVFFYAYGDHQDLHSFPTRRSSDLSNQLGGNGGNGGAGGSASASVFSVGFGPTNGAAYTATATGGNGGAGGVPDRKSTRLNSSHVEISYAVFCLKKKKKNRTFLAAV